MKETIYREDAINTIKEMCRNYTETKSEEHPHVDFVIEELMKLPSAEPETKLVAEVTLTKDQIQDAVDKAIDKMRAELAPCDFCKYKDDCGDMAMYCPAERRTDECD